MELDRSLLKEFAKITNDSEVKTETKQLKGTIVKNSGGKYVQLDGSTTITPITGVVDYDEGDRVLVSIENHKATILGNFTYAPSARKEQEAIDKADTAQNTADLAGEVANAAQIKAQEASANADTALNQSALAGVLADEAKEEAAEAINKANTASANATEAKTLANEANTASSEAKQLAAESQASSAEAQAEVTRLQGEVDTAKGNIDKALEDLDAQASEISTVKTTYSTKVELENAKASLSTEITEKVGLLETTIAKDYATKTENVELEGRLQTQITQNAEGFASQAGKIEKLESDTTQAQEDVADALAKAGAAQTTASEAQEKADAAKSAADSATTNAQAAEEKAEAARSTADEAIAAANNADKAVQEAQGDLDEAKQNLANVTSRVDATEADIAEAQAKVDAAQTSVNEALADAAEANLAATKAQEAADKAQTDAETAQGVANTAQQKADNAQTAADNAQAAAEQAQADVAALTSRVVTAETNISNNAEQIALTATKTVEIGEKVDSVEDDLSNNYYTKTQTDAAIKVQSDRISSTVSKVETVEKNAIVSTVDEFYLSTSPTELSGGSWDTEQPIWTEGMYLWRRSLVTKGDGTSSYQPSQNGVCITGNTGVAEKPLSFKSAKGEYLTLTECGNYPFKSKIVEGNSFQATRSGKNLCPDIDQWVLQNGAYIENGYIVLPNENSSAYVDFEWNKKSKNIYFSFITDSSNTNYGYHVTVIYKDENGNNLSENGSAKADLNGETKCNISYGGDNQYGEALSEATKVRFLVMRSSYATQEYKFKNVICSSVQSDVSEYEPYGQMPSPGFESEAQCWTGPQKVTTCGENLLDLEKLNNSTETWIVPCKKLTLKLKPNTQYTCSSNVPGFSGDQPLYFNNNSWSAGGGVCNGTSRTTTTDENGYLYISVCTGRTYAEELLNGTYYIQIEEGTTATPYKPYQGKTYNFTLADKYHRLQNGVKDTIEWKDGKWKRAQRAGEQVLGNISNITTSTIFGHSNAKYVSYSLVNSKNIIRNYDFYCNKIISANEEYVVYGGYRNLTDFVVIVDDEDTVETVNQKLSDSVIYYELAEPIYTDITDPELLDFLNTASTYEGITHMFCDSDVKPTFDVEYWTYYRGATGASGKGIVNTDITYQGSTSGITIPTGEWSETIPTVAVGSFLWTRTITVYTDGSETTGYSVSKMGENGQPGSDGKGIKSAVTTYQAAANGTIVPTGTWSTEVPTTTADKPYLWTRTITTYTDNTESTAYAVGATPEGIVVGGRNLVLNSNAGWTSTEYNVVKNNLTQDWVVGETYTISIKGTTNEGNRFGLWRDGGSQCVTNNIPYNSDKDIHEYTFVCPEPNDDATVFNTFGIYNVPSDTATEASIEWIKIERGNKATDWTPAPEDINTNIGNLENNMNGRFDDVNTTISEAQSKIDQLADMIANLVTDQNGTSMMTQTSTGWTFNMASINDNLTTLKDYMDLDKQDKVDTNDAIAKLNNLIEELANKTAYIRMDTDENGDPYIELGKADNNFKVRITNTAIDFLEGSSRIAYANNNTFYSTKIIVKSELQIGEGPGFVWRTRANGNMGLVYIS